MAKVKLNKEGVQGFFVRHVEKIILGVVIMLVAVFVYSGYSLESLPSERTPDRLVSTAKDAKQKVTNPSNWENIFASLTIPSGHEQRARQSQNPVDVLAYALDKPLEPKNLQSGQKREDPTLYPPEKVEATAVTGPVAYMLQRGETDPLAEFENSEPEIVKEKRVAPKPQRRRGGGGSSEGYPGMDSEGDSSESGAYPGMAGMSSAGMPGMPGSSMSGMPGMMPGMGMPGAQGTAPGAMVMADASLRTGFRASPGSIAKARTCVAVKALVPWQKQWDEYETKLSEAMGYSPARDVPRYLFFRAERAEVTGDPDAPLNWQQLTHTNKIYAEIRNEGYAGLPQEIADPRYLQPFVLTMPVPPFIDRDLEKLALHSEVPKAQAQMQPTPEQLEKQKKANEAGKEKDKGPIADVPTGMPNGNATGMPGMGMPGMPGMGSGSMMPGMPGMGSGSMMPGMPGMGSGSMMPGMPGMGSGSMMPGMSSMESASESEGSMSGMGMGMSGMPGMGSGSMMPGMGSGSMMPGMPGMPGMTQVQRGPLVPSLMIRFFDFEVEPGKQYRYRVQVLLEDPNHPQNPQMEPSERSLDDTVKKRINLLSADKEKTNRKFFRSTEFSEPSDIVTVDIPTQAFAGKIEPTRFVPMREAGPGATIQVEEPAGKVMAVQWDPDLAVDVPGIIDSFRGTYLNFSSKADVIHPVSLVYKQVKTYDFATDQLIADIRGGEELPSSDKNSTLVSLGEYAYFDENGEFQIASEFEDFDSFKKLALPVVTAPAMSMGEGESESGGPPGMPGMPGMRGSMPGMMPGMPGMGGGRKPGRKR